MKAMTWDPPKGSPTVPPNPRPLSWIVVFLGVLALFLICASGILASYPPGSAVREYFYGVDSSRLYILSVSPVNETSTDDVISNESLDLADDEPPSDLEPYTVSTVNSSDNKIEDDTVIELDSQVSSSESASPEFQGTKEVNDLAPSDSAASSSQELVTMFGNITDKVNSTLPAPSDTQINPTSTAISIDDKIEDDTVTESDSQVPSSESPLPEFQKTKEANDLAPSDSEASSSQEPVTLFGNGTDKVNNILPAPSESQINSTSTSTAISSTADVSSSNLMGNITIDEPTSAALMNNSSTLTTTSNETSQSPSDSMSTAVPVSSGEPNNESYAGAVTSGCDLFHGNWVYDPRGPLYTNDSCPVLSYRQNCQGNGRPDKDYENWRWKPFQCDIPRFNPRKFLKLMRGKTLAFIGDSVARNQMESMMCILWQVEKPRNHGNRNMQQYYFRSTSTKIVRIWSSWLVKHSSEAFDYAPEGVDKLFLDAPDETVIKYLPTFDVVVLSSGHWFAKQSVYVLNDEIVGGQLWWPDKSKPMKIDNVEAFSISVETMFRALATNSNFTGLAILRSYSPDHYEGGAWNTGGSCTGKVKPLAIGEVVENNHTNTMYEQQVTGFNRAAKNATGRSKLRFMDITEAFNYRHDGHPGPYRNRDPNKITERGPDGRPPPQDCLHWCMPGPVDTWNEILFEVLKKEYGGGNAS